MRLGLHPVDFTAAGDDLAGHLARLGAAVEEAGMSHLQLMDHHLQLSFVGDLHDPVPEGYTTLGFLAAHTSSVRLGLLVTGVTYRHPGLLAHVVATLDVLSRGRAVLGLGAAWYEREHHALGVPFPPLAERFEHLEDALRICRQMWSDDDGPFQGHRQVLSETVCHPRPLQRHLPILVGGGGERKTLRLVARYADACNIIGAADVVGRKLAILDRHCAEVGRDPAEVERTVLIVEDTLTDPDDTLEQLRGLAGLGVTTTFLVPHGDAVTWTERAGRELVAPAAPL
ncbi:MAG: LLM class F420-dependent oxidoreductase [Actinobacteria bacterium]|nr:LLM class F420-dependent oxidoreductase [Actinomycetota bacterium]